MWHLQMKTLTGFFLFPFNALFTSERKGEEEKRKESCKKSSDELLIQSRTPSKILLNQAEIGVFSGRREKTSPPLGRSNQIWEKLDVTGESCKG